MSTPAPGVKKPPSQSSNSNTPTAQVCPYFLKGRCWRGDKCKKAHVSNGSESKNGTSSHDQTSNGTIPQAFAETTLPEPTEPCAEWNDGVCYNGDNCDFRHDREADSRGDRAAKKSEPSVGEGKRRRRRVREGKSINVVMAEIQDRREAEMKYLQDETERQRGGEEEKRRLDAERQRQEEEKRQRQEEERQRREEEERQRLEEEERRLRELQEKNRREAEERERIRRETEERERRRAKAREKGRRDAERRREAQRLREAEERRQREEAEAERRRLEEEAERERQRRLREAEEERLRQEAERRAREQEAARREERDRLDQAKTVQHLVFGNTIVKFKSGVDIEQIITGFDSCRVRVSGFPFSTKPNDVCKLVYDQGIDADDFELVNVRVWKGKKEANLIVDGELGRELAEDLDGFHWRGQTLSAEASASGSIQGMSSNNSAALQISWVLPSVRYIVHFETATDATQMNKSMDGHNFNGRKIKVEPNRPRGQQKVDPRSLLVSRLPMGTAVGDVRDLFKATALKKLRSNEYNDEPVEGWLKDFILKFMRGGFVEFNPVQVNTFEGKCTMRIQFKSWEDAKKVHDQFVNVKFDIIGNSMFRLWLPDPYQITVPMEQYQAQKKQWDAFVKDTKDRKESSLHVRMLEDKVILRVGGDDLKSVGMLKVRVESLVAGEILRDMWHAWFDSAPGKKFLESVHTDTGAYIRHDHRLRVLKVYGASAAISKAKETMRAELEKLSGQEHTETLKRQSIRFFVERGVAALKEAFGDDSVTLNISSSPVCITIRGGEEARHLLRKLIDESLYNVTTDFSAPSESSCPVCLADVSNPVKLGCGHEYCTACLRHFFTADIRDFPVVCVGDEATCMKPIALPTIQKFLTEPQFNTLLETAFTKHLEQNHQTYRYCSTPDCRQIYRCEEDSSTITDRQCPSCHASICMKCHGESHEGLSCDERREHFEPPEHVVLNEAWAKRAGAKRCPSCQVWIEKIEGCHHMTCKCGAHVCWVCMEAFDVKVIYDHMVAAHGGYYERREPGFGMEAGDEHVYVVGRDEPTEVPEVNRYLEQVEALRVVAERARTVEEARRRMQAMRAEELRVEFARRQALEQEQARKRAEAERAEAARAEAARAEAARAQRHAQLVEQIRRQRAQEAEREAEARRQDHFRQIAEQEKRAQRDRERREAEARRTAALARALEQDRQRAEATRRQQGKDSQKEWCVVM
ncbi:hypothetical protein AAF712_016224 [Marasmius tenuissimus]|uniref:RBR-type E3 ubiquitin transferase n=1 Tax=Marasmius tenuissimus TaxID=585030 RepID=A0ABR2Z7B5_9AGAR